MFGVPHRRAHLGKLLDRVADLLVEDAPVGDDDDRVEDLLSQVRGTFGSATHFAALESATHIA